jgi:hypothetical protein
MDAAHMLVASLILKGVPCGRIVGHGESCVAGWECDSCTARIKAARELGAPQPAIIPATPVSASSALATAAEGFQSWDVLDAAHMLVASLIVDLVGDNDRPAFLRKMDRILRDRVKEIGARQKPRLVV